MQNAFERVLEGEYKVVIEEELGKLKSSDRMLVDGACAVLYRTDENLDRVNSECETEEKSCYIVLMPSKYSIICNKDLGALKSEDESLKIVSLNYFVEQLLQFNFTFLQLIEDDAIIYATKEFKKLITNYKDKIACDDYLSSVRYTTFVSTAMSIYSDIKSGKIQNNNACENRLFLLYAVCEACNHIMNTGRYSINHIVNLHTYDEIRSKYLNNKDMNILKENIEKIKHYSLNMENRDKDEIKFHRLQIKYQIMHAIIMGILLEV